MCRFDVNNGGPEEKIVGPFFAGRTQPGMVCAVAKQCRGLGRGLGYYCSFHLPLEVESTDVTLALEELVLYTRTYTRINIYTL